MATRRRAWLALLLLVPVPSLGAWLALIAAPGPWGRGAYLLAKAWILLLPLWWRWKVERAPLSLSPLPRAQRGRALREGALWGLGLAAGLLGVWWLAGERLLDAKRLREVARASGFAATPAFFLAFALQLAFVNALLEEYVWRWFVMARWEELVPRAAAPLAALCFTLHHALAFTVQFGALLGGLASLAVLGAGWLWGWQYRRWRSVWPGYVCHVLVDLAALGVGWKVLM